MAVTAYSYFVPTGAERQEQRLTNLAYQLDFFPAPLATAAAAQRVTAPPPLTAALAFVFKTPIELFRDAIVRPRTDPSVPSSLVHAFDAVDAEGYPVRMFTRAHQPLFPPAQYSPEF